MLSPEEVRLERIALAILQAHLMGRWANFNDYSAMSHDAIDAARTFIAILDGKDSPASGEAGK